MPMDLCLFMLRALFQALYLRGEVRWPGADIHQASLPHAADDARLNTTFYCRGELSRALAVSRFRPCHGPTSDGFSAVIRRFWLMSLLAMVSAQIASRHYAFTEFDIAEEKRLYWRHPPRRGHDAMPLERLTYRRRRASIEISAFADKFRDFLAEMPPPHLPLPALAPLDA